METLGHGASTSVGPRHDTAAKASMTDLAALYPMASVNCKSEPTKPNERCSTQIAAKAQTCSTAVAPPLNVYSLPRCDRTGNEADPRVGLVSCSVTSWKRIHVERRGNGGGTGLGLRRNLCRAPLVGLRRLRLTVHRRHRVERRQIGHRRLCGGIVPRPDGRRCAVSQRLHRTQGGSPAPSDQIALVHALHLDASTALD